MKKVAENDFIQKMKKQVWLNKKTKNGISVSPFSICEPVLYIDRVVMPYTLQKKILEEFHTGHPEILIMKSLMRDYTYWPRMDQNIENLVKQCRRCQLAARDPLVKIQPWPTTDVPWTQLHINYAGPPNRSYYLIIVDSGQKLLSADI